MFALVLSVLAASADVELVAQQKEAPKGAQPQFVQATFEDDKLVCRVTVTSYKTEKRIIEVEDNGKKVKKEVAVTVPVLRQIDYQIDPKKATIATASGKKLDLDALKKRLAKPQVVVVSGDYKAVDEAYLKVLDKDTIVIVPEAPKQDKPVAIPVSAEEGQG